MAADIPEREARPAPAFAGDLLLRLANSGAWVLEPEVADELVERVSAALATIRLWHALNVMLRRQSRASLTWPEPSEEQPLFDAAFTEQVAPGRLQQALVELPKYLEALKIARGG